MKKHILYLLILALLAFGVNGCIPGDKAQKEEIPKSVPSTINYSDEIIQIIIPEAYDPKTGCYYKTFTKNSSDLVAINAFSGGKDAEIKFLLTIKPNRGFIFSGEQGLALFHYNEEKIEWEEITYTIDESTPLWDNGDVLTEGNYIHIGKKICHFFPDSPIILYPKSENGTNVGKYRLYVWGFELNQYDMIPYAFIGDYIEFSLGTE